MSRSANNSQAQVDCGSESGSMASPSLSQRRCQSLGKFPDQEGGRQGTSGRHLAVPHPAYPNASNGKPAARKRKESKSLEFFPSEMRSSMSDRSPLPSCTSQEDNEDERALLLEEDDSIILTVPNGDGQQQQQQQASFLNGNLRSSGGGYQAVRLIQNENDRMNNVDVHSESSTGRVRKQQHPRLSSVSVSGRCEEQEKKKWHSCDQLHRQTPPTSTADQKRSRDTNGRDTPIASAVKWLVNLFGKNPPAAEEITDIQREERERREETSAV